MSNSSWQLYGVTLSAGDFRIFTLLHELGHLAGGAPNDSNLGQDDAADFGASSHSVLRHHIH
jgi:hypothetical protein